MKKQALKRIFGCLLAAVTAFTAVGATVFADDAVQTVYKKTDAITKGEQGADGWYYMYESGSNGYKEMTWNGSDTFNGIMGGNINVHFVIPGYDTPTVLAWEAPYTGTVTLTEQDSVVYRDGADELSGDVTATLLLNDTILTDDNGNKTQWTFDNTCKNGVGNQSYVVTNLKINKGDVLYHKVDCGKNNRCTTIYWKPIVTYTNIESTDIDVTEFKMVDDIKVGETQGYHGWHYMYKTADGFADMQKKEKTSDADGYKWSQGDNWLNYFQVQPAWNRATAIGWQAPYSGTITLTRTGAFRRLGKGNGDVTTSILHNDKLLKQNDGTDAEWIFEKTENWETGPNREYEITGVKVNAGDWIYHVLDCGEYNSSPNLQWQPHIIYTDIKKEIDGEGTIESPYIINSITDYKKFADIVNGTNPSACAKLMSDMTWNINTPQLENFAGTIDGNGHKFTLKGKALIKSAADGAAVKNLIVDGVVSGAENVGAIIEKTPGTGITFRIENSASFASVKATTDYAAGFVGLTDGSDKLYMFNCYSLGIVSSTGTQADPFACAGLYAEVVYSGCNYLTGNTTSSVGAAAPSVSGVKACDDKTFDIMTNGVVFGYSEDAAKLIIARYNGAALADVELRDIEAGSFIRAEFAMGDNAAVKAFLWDGTESMKPALEARVAEIR